MAVMPRHSSLQAGFATIEELEPRTFSFNNPFGACPACHGLGMTMEFTEAGIIPDPTLSINQGAIAVTGWNSATEEGSFTRSVLNALTKAYSFSLDTPYEELPDAVRNMLLYGTDGQKVDVHYKSQRGQGVYDVAFEGLLENVRRRYRETTSESMRQEYESYMEIRPCTECQGKRLRKEALAVTVGERNIDEVCNLPARDLRGFLQELKLSPAKMTIGDRVLREIRARVGFLCDVLHLNYLPY